MKDYTESIQLLNLPVFDYRIRHTKEGSYIFDIIRKKYVRLMPEEWVRQHFLHYLTSHLAYPRSLIKLEQGLRYNHRQHRSDMVIYDRSAKPFMLVECKAPSVTIHSDIFRQIARYNVHLKAKLLVATNGFTHFCWQLDYAQGRHILLQDIPCFSTSLQE